MATNDLKGRVDLDVAGALNAINTAKRAFNDLAKASTDAGAKMTASQTRATQAIIARYEKLRVAQSKVVDNAIALERKMKEMERNGVNARSNSRLVTGAKVDALTTAAADKTVESQSRVALNAARAVTEQKRQQVMLTDLAGRNAARQAATELALRKQIFREQQAALRAQNEMTTGVGGLRFALHDATSQIALLSAGLLAATVGSAAVAIAWERDFANVERVTEANVNQLLFLRKQLVGLVTTMPVAFEDLTKIATLGGQMGVAEQNIAGFTKTVAMFAATTDVSVEETATAFGRLNSLIPDIRNDFTGLGDTIARVGVKSVATEGQIIRVATQISSLTGAANFGYKATIGLAGALASVGVPPELSRGVVTRVFGTISRAVSDGTVNMTKFANIAGMSAKEFEQGWNSNAPDTFLAFMDGIKNKGRDAESAIRELGITSVRDVPVLMRLANAADSAGRAGGLLAQTFRDANDAAGELQRQYDIIADTTASKLQVMFQNLLAVIDQIGGTQLGFLGDVLDNLTRAMRSFGDSLDEPVKLLDMFELPFTNADALGVVGVIAAIVAGLGLFVAVTGQVIAGGIAMGQVIATARAHFTGYTVAANTATAANRVFAVSATGVATSTTAAAASSRKMGGALKGLGATAAITAAVFGVGWLAAVADDMARATTGVDEFKSKLMSSTDALKSFMSIEVSDGGMGLGVGAVDVKAFDNIKAFKDALGTIKDDGFWADIGHKTFNAEAFHSVTAAADLLDTSLSELFDAGNSAKAIDYFTQITNGADLSGTEINTLLDRADGIKSRFSQVLAGLGLEATDMNLQKLAKGTLPAYNRAAEEALNVTEGTADAFVDAEEGVGNFLDTVSKRLTSFISFDEAYAASIDAANAKAKVAWVAAGNDVSDFVEVAEGSLEDFFLTMEKQVAAQQTFAANLATVLRDAGPDVAAAASELAPQILQQLVDGGPAAMERFKGIVSAGGVEGVAAMSTAITSMAAPDVQAAFAKMGDDAAKEWMLKILTGEATIEEMLKQFKPTFTMGAPLLSPAQQAINDFFYRNNGKVLTLNVDIVARNNALEGMTDQSGRPINVGQWADGGYTGPGGKYQAKGIVHAGEFVFTKAAVSNIGTDYLYGLMNNAEKGYSSGGAVNNSASYSGNSAGARSRSTGITVVELSAYDRFLLERAGDFSLYLGKDQVTKATNDQTINSFNRGTR